MDEGELGVWRNAAQFDIGQTGFGQGSGHLVQKSGLAHRAAAEVQQDAGSTARAQFGADLAFHAAAKDNLGGRTVCKVLHGKITS